MRWSTLCRRAFVAVVLAACARDTALCPAGEGPTMVRAGDFCIDSTEVTNRQYQRFLDATGGVSSQGAPCAWNRSLVPRVWPPPARSSPEHPVVFVDWCDAQAYCQWAGKRLCGRIGGGGSLRIAEQTDATRSQWMSACTGGGASVYPYGDAYASGACSGDEPTGYFLPVASKPACVGGFPGVYDLSGNVHELEDSCDVDPAVLDGSMDICADRGGSFKHDPGMLACGLTLDKDPRSGQWFDVGFRCCSP